MLVGLPGLGDVTDFECFFFYKHFQAYTSAKSLSLIVCLHVQERKIQFRRLLRGCCWSKVQVIGLWHVLSIWTTDQRYFVERFDQSTRRVMSHEWFVRPQTLGLFFGSVKFPLANVANVGDWLPDFLTQCGGMQLVSEEGPLQKESTLPNIICQGRAVHFSVVYLSRQFIATKRPVGHSNR